MPTRREMVAAGIAAMGTGLIAPTRSRGADHSKMIDAGRRFLVELFDPQLDLLPEFAGSSTYWLYHDNYLAAKMLAGHDDDKARKIQKRIADLGVTRSGKIEILFGEAAHPLPFHQFSLDVVQKIGGKVIMTERITDRILRGWEEYADLLALSILADPDPPEAATRWKRLVAMWDGKGLADRVVEVNKIYAFYKVPLFLLAARKLKRQVPFEGELVDRIVTQQNARGGWITDYDLAGTPVGLANVETTCIALLALASL